MIRKSLLAAALPILATASSSFAAVLYFSTSAGVDGATSKASATYPAPGAATLTLSSASPTGLLYLYAKLDPTLVTLQVSDGMGGFNTQVNPEVLQALGLDANLHGSTHFSLGPISTGSANGGVFINPKGGFDTRPRWDNNAGGAVFVPVGGQLWSGLNLAAVTGRGADPTSFDKFTDTTDGIVKLGQVMIKWDGVSTPAGTVDLAINSNKVTWQKQMGDGFPDDTGAPTTKAQLFFGTDPTPIDNAQTGATSQIPMATIVVPEPASLSLLGLGALGLIARRRRA